MATNAPTENGTGRLIDFATTCRILGLSRSMLRRLVAEGPKELVAASITAPAAHHSPGEKVSWVIPFAGSRRRTTFSRSSRLQPPPRTPGHRDRPSLARLRRPFHEAPCAVSS